MATSDGSTIDLSTLSESQQLALGQYTAVTGEELGAAVPLLQKCQWNAQIAITRFFDGDAETIDPVAEAARAPPPPEARRADTLLDGIPSRASHPAAYRGGLEPAPRVVPTASNQLSQPLPFPLSILVLPFNITYTIFQRLFGAVGYVFPFLPRLLSRFYSGRASQPSRDSGRRPLSPRDTAARFIREFEEEYGVTHGTLPFHEEGYAQAFDMAKRELKYLLVVLLSPEHDDTAPFIRETLLSPELVSFIKQTDNNIILWAGTVQDAEAFQVASALNVTRFPYVCLVVHTPSVSATAMSRVATSAGPISAHDLIGKLRTAMETQSQELERVRAQRSEQHASRSLRQEQESAYERSLAQDREKARKKKEDSAAQEKAAREEREVEERKADRARKLSQWRKWRAYSIAEEPTSDVKDAVRMSVRLPSGERVVRRFDKDTSLEDLCVFVECYDLLQEMDQHSEKVPERPTDYEHEYDFNLVSPMPRVVYSAKRTGTLRDLVGRSGNLIVEKIVPENEDEDDESPNGAQ